MTDQFKFTFDGRKVLASADETIWQVVKREGMSARMVEVAF